MARGRTLYLPVMIAAALALSLVVAPAAMAQTGSVEGESFTHPRGTAVVYDQMYSGGAALKFKKSKAVATKQVTITETSTMLVRARADQKKGGSPTLTIRVDGENSGTRRITSSALADYNYPAVTLQPGTYTIGLKGCNIAQGRNVFVDVVSFPAVAPPPDVGRIYYSQQGNVYSMKPDGSDVQQLTHITDFRTSANYPSVSPDGNKVVYLAEDMRPWVMNADGTNLMPTVDPHIQAGNGRVSFSPDGQYIIFNEQSTIGGIVKQNVDLQTPAQSFLPYNGIYPDWGSDNRIYSSIYGSGGTGGLYSDNPDGTDLSLLVSRIVLQEVNVSPDGTKMVYADRSQAGHGLYISNTDGTNQQVLVPKGSFYDLRFPDWSPDGSKIVFEGTTNVSGDPTAKFRRDLYMVNPDGSNVVNITANKVENRNGPTMPAWGVSPQ